ncbi:hypothetical protein SAMN06265349_102166 [Flavobacterium resistens]|uniref:Uncharacterized protein n=1 Tax=Flavobacterium resistens TaxID=443612 RepID=A0A521C3J6_9FLAO|nr:hypothetical protein [Flavobacterium resistens]MRX69616.1 hypothetical protein [Flavobacterium resistens]SMO53974.1 hypothetical protein SAMN06265349_102166 [Flavobacterium resistens]
MKEEDKNLENLIERMMAENTLQSPSADFTSNLMSQILVAEKAKIKPYKPLISISTWIFIGIALILLVIYNMFFAGAENNLEIGKSYTDKISAIVSGIHISKTLLYSILIVPFMVLIQVGVLKNYFDKKYQL